MLIELLIYFSLVSFSFLSISMTLENYIFDMKNLQVSANRGRELLAFTQDIQLKLRKSEIIKIEDKTLVLTIHEKKYRVFLDNEIVMVGNDEIQVPMHSDVINFESFIPKIIESELKIFVSIQFEINKKQYVISYSREK